MFDVSYNTHQYFQSSSNTAWINIALTVANILITVVINFFIFSARRKNEREYQYKASLFSAIVVENFDKIVKFPHDVAAAVSSLDSSVCRNMVLVEKAVQKACDDIEGKLEEFNSNIIPLLLVYDKNIARDTFVKVEEYCDKLTALVAGMVESGGSLKYINEEITKLKSEYSANINSVVERCRPVP